MSGEERLLTVPEVAERMRVTAETVRRWLREKRLRGVRVGGTKTGWRIPESEMRRLLSGGSFPAPMSAGQNGERERR